MDLNRKKYLYFCSLDNELNYEEDKYNIISITDDVIKVINQYQLLGVSIKKSDLDRIETKMELLENLIAFTITYTKKNIKKKLVEFALKNHDAREKEISERYQKEISRNDELREKLIKM